MTLFNQNVDVVSFHTGSSAVMAAAQERGKMAIAYHSDMRSVAPDAQIAAVTHRWGEYYTARAKAVLDGDWKTGAVWGGVREGMIRVDDFGPKVPKGVQTEVLNAQKAMAQGKLLPFQAKEAVRDNEGQVVIAKGETLSDEKILGMNWLVAGVQGKISH
jgi:simple sugar transport system substrate-binding protein